MRFHAGGWSGLRPHFSELPLRQQSREYGIFIMRFALKECRCTSQSNCRFLLRRFSCFTPNCNTDCCADRGTDNAEQGIAAYVFTNRTVATKLVLLLRSINNTVGFA
jgi:hypothetical protein